MSEPEDEMLDALVWKTRLTSDEREYVSTHLPDAVEMYRRILGLEATVISLSYAVNALTLKRDGQS